MSFRPRRSLSLVRGSTDYSVEERNAKLIRDRPDFTTLMKTTPRKTGYAVNEKTPGPRIRAGSLGRSSEHKVTVRPAQLGSRREQIANSFTYESILHDLVVNLKALQIRTQARSTAHDADAIAEYVGRRAEETVEEEINNYIKQLEIFQGSSPTHRITAHAQLASALTAATDKLIFHPNHDKVTEELKRHKKDELVKDAILIEMKKKDIALNDIILAKNKEIDNLTTKISGLSYELRAAERNGEASKGGLTEALTSKTETEELLVEMRMQGLDFKSEVDRRCNLALVAIKAQFGYIPDAVERELLLLQTLLPPGDAKYDFARILRDPKSIRKLRLLDYQKDENFKSEKWHQTFIDNANLNSNLNLTKNSFDKKTFLNNNTENEKKKISIKSYSEPLSIKANEKMNDDTNTLLLMLTHFGDQNNNQNFEGNFNEFLSIQAASCIDNNDDKNIDNNNKNNVQNISRNGNKVDFIPQKKIMKRNKDQENNKLSNKKEKKKITPLSDSKYTALKISKNDKINNNNNNNHSNNNDDNDNPYDGNNNYENKNNNVIDINQKNSSRNFSRKRSKSPKVLIDNITDFTESVNDLYDQKYENFRYSVNMLRESILQGTVIANTYNNGNNNNSHNSNNNNYDIKNNSDNNSDDNDSNSHNSYNRNNNNNNSSNNDNRNNNDSEKYHNNSNENVKDRRNKSNDRNELNNQIYDHDTTEKEKKRKDTSVSTSGKFQDNSLSYYNSLVEDALIDDYSDFKNESFYRNINNKIESINNSSMDNINNSTYNNISYSTRYASDDNSNNDNKNNNDNKHNNDNQNNSNDYSNFIALNSNKKEHHNINNNNDKNNDNYSKNSYDSTNNNNIENSTDKQFDDTIYSNIHSRQSERYTSEPGSDSINKIRQERTKSEWVDWAKNGRREPLFQPDSRQQNIFSKGSEGRDPGSKFQLKDKKNVSESNFRYNNNGENICFSPLSVSGVELGSENRNYLKDRNIEKSIGKTQVRTYLNRDEDNDINSSYNDINNNDSSNNNDYNNNSNNYHNDNNDNSNNNNIYNHNNNNNNGMITSEEKNQNRLTERYSNFETEKEVISDTSYSGIFRDEQSIPSRMFYSDRDNENEITETDNERNQQKNLFLSNRNSIKAISSPMKYRGPSPTQLDTYMQEILQNKKNLKDFEF